MNMTNRRTVETQRDTVSSVSAGIGVLDGIGEMI